MPQVDGTRMDDFQQVFANMAYFDLLYEKCAKSKLWIALLHLKIPRSTLAGLLLGGMGDGEWGIRRDG